MQAETARIGPNAILQTILTLDRRVGRDLRDRVMQAAAVPLPPADAGMLPETDCAAVHQAVRHLLPDQARALLTEAGLSTGDYILTHRIPAFAKAVIRILPRGIAARALARAIAKHAWTFAGSGRFRILSHHPLCFEIDANPLRAKPADDANCCWHSAVFQRLFDELVWPGLTVTELRCGSVDGGPCQFVLTPADPKP